MSGPAIHFPWPRSWLEPPSQRTNPPVIATGRDEITALWSSSRVLDNFGGRRFAAWPQTRTVERDESVRALINRRTGNRQQYTRVYSSAPERKGARRRSLSAELHARAMRRGSHRRSTVPERARDAKAGAPPNPPAKGAAPSSTRALFAGPSAGPLRSANGYQVEILPWEDDVEC